MAAPPDFAKKSKAKPVEVVAEDDFSDVRISVPYACPNTWDDGPVRALLVGITYRGQEGQLNGCANDLQTWLGTLERLKVPLGEALILTDDPEFPEVGGLPTRANIIRGIKWLTRNVTSGARLLFIFSGHGASVPSEGDDEEDGMDEAIVPLDYEENGLILDNDLFALLCKDLPAGAKLFAVSDSCHSGTVLDLPFQFATTKKTKFAKKGMQMRPVPQCFNFTEGHVVFISGCQDKQTSSDLGDVAAFGAKRDGAGGALTTALTMALDAAGPRGLPLGQLAVKLRDRMVEAGMTQLPQIAASQPLDMYGNFTMLGLTAQDKELAPLLDDLKVFAEAAAEAAAAGPGAWEDEECEEWEDCEECEEEGEEDEEEEAEE